jgi:hypothetical protein
MQKFLDIYKKKFIKKIFRENVYVTWNSYAIKLANLLEN